MVLYPWHSYSRAPLAAPTRAQGVHVKTHHIANNKQPHLPFQHHRPTFGLSHQLRQLCSSGRPLLRSGPGRRHFRLPQQQGSRRQFPTRQHNRRCVSLVPGEGGAEVGCGRQRCKRAVSYCGLHAFALFPVQSRQPTARVSVYTRRACDTAVSGPFLPESNFNVTQREFCAQCIHVPPTNILRARSCECSIMGTRNLNMKKSVSLGPRPPALPPNPTASSLVLF